MLSIKAMRAIGAYTKESLITGCFGIWRVGSSARYYVRAVWLDGRKFYDVLVIGLDGLPVRTRECITPRQALNLARALGGFGTPLTL